MSIAKRNYAKEGRKTACQTVRAQRTGSTPASGTGPVKVCGTWYPLVIASNVPSCRRARLGAASNHAPADALTRDQALVIETGRSCLKVSAWRELIIQERSYSIHCAPPPNTRRACRLGQSTCFASDPPGPHCALSGAASSNLAMTDPPKSGVELCESPTAFAVHLDRVA